MTELTPLMAKGMEIFAAHSMGVKNRAALLQKHSEELDDLLADQVDKINSLVEQYEALGGVPSELHAYFGGS